MIKPLTQAGKSVKSPIPLCGTNCSPICICQPTTAKE